MPPKIRELIKSLKQAGFEDRGGKGSHRNRGGKGSHRNFVHPNVSKPVTIFGKLGDDAKKYQMRAVEKAVQEAKK